MPHRSASPLSVALALAILATPAAALEAVAKAKVNVRTGPGTTYSVVDKLEPGETVAITECSPLGWCFAEHAGPDGWVSADFLLPAGPADDDTAVTEAPSGPDCGFGFSIGPDGPSLTVSCGDQAAPGVTDAGPDEADPDGPQACFYINDNYAGNGFCMVPGVRNTLTLPYRDKISSVEVTPGLTVRLCVDTNLQGYCKTILADVDSLPAQINNKTSSIEVSAEPLAEGEPGPLILDPDLLGKIPKLLAPKTHSTGPIGWKQTWLIDLDDGSQDSSPGNDLWYEAVSAAEKYVTPTNGAKLSVDSFGQRGYLGCAAATYTETRMPIDAASVGKYVCVKTNAGRIAEFRINGFVGTTMNIGYTTWQP